MLARGQVAGLGVQTHAKAGGLIQAKSLSDQAGDDTGQHITHPATGHAGIPGNTNIRDRISGQNQTAGAFQYDGSAILGLQGMNGCKPIALDFGVADIQESARFAGMRGQNPMVISTG
jgi:hypothetical protein